MLRNAGGFCSSSVEVSSGRLVLGVIRTSFESSRPKKLLINPALQLESRQEDYS